MYELKTWEWPDVSREVEAKQKQQAAYFKFFTDFVAILNDDQLDALEHAVHVRFREMHQGHPEDLNDTGEDLG